MTTDGPGTGTARPTIQALSEPFERSLIRMKPGGKRPATPYISHGLVTKRLNDVCPGWTSRLVEMHAYVDGNGVLQCAGVTLELTIPGVGSRVEFGTSANRNGFGADAKNAMSDALKRCAMRFGVAIDLWEKMDEDDEDAQTVTPQERRPAPSRPAPRQTAPVAAPYRVEPEPAPEAPRQLRPAEPPTAGDDGWTSFWSWAKKAGYQNRADLDAAAGESTTGKTPPEIRALIEQRAG